MRRYVFPGLCIVALVMALHTLTIASGIPAALAVEPLEIVTAGGTTRVFNAHVADTPEARSRGLMYVTRLEPDQAMLFDFEVPQVVTMWMKNTPLSLDMLFIDEHGLIAHIERRTRPFSTRLISSRSRVLAVLEIGGGRAEQLGIAVGDRVLHRIFPAETPPAM